MGEEPARSPKKTAQRARQERRYLPRPTGAARWMVGLGALGAGALGAGVCGQWLLTEPKPYAQWLVMGGALGLAAVLWFGDSTAHPVRVGDAGLAIEQGTELTRLAWCDIESLKLTASSLLVKGKGGLSLELPLEAHATAVARAVAEAQRRVPDVAKLSEAEQRRVGEPKDAGVPLTAVEGVQVAGKRCAATERPIAFERDARFCGNCGEVYLKGHVPGTCATCGRATGKSEKEAA